MRLCELIGSKCESRLLVEVRKIYKQNLSTSFKPPLSPAIRVDRRDGLGGFTDTRIFWLWMIFQTNDSFDSQSGSNLLFIMLRTTTRMNLILLSHEFLDFWEN